MKEEKKVQNQEKRKHEEMREEKKVQLEQNKAACKETRRVKYNNKTKEKSSEKRATSRKAEKEEIKQENTAPWDVSVKEFLNVVKKTEEE